MTHAELEHILRVLAAYIPNSGMVGDLRRIADAIRYRPADFDRAVMAIDGHDTQCERELTSHGYTHCRCDERINR